MYLCVIRGYLISVSHYHLVYAASHTREFKTPFLDIPASYL